MTFRRLRVSTNCDIKTQQYLQLKLIIMDLHPMANRQGNIFFENSIEAHLWFCEDYDKIVYGLKHSLTLVRKTDNDVISREAAAVLEK